MKKLLAILPLLLAGCAQPQPTRADENHRHAQSRGGLLPAIRRHPGAGANTAGRQHSVQTTQRRNPRRVGAVAPGSSG